MSVEITLYPRAATREQLRRLVVSFGSQNTGHLWDWPKGSLHFVWYDDSDFKSADGVEITIYPLTREEQNDRASGPWALHTRTRSAASSFDREQQNSIVRAARRAFGGWFYNDWHGRNRYTPVEPDRRGPAGRGIALAYEHVTLQVTAVRDSLPKAAPGYPTEGKLAVIARLDPSRVLYNALVPFVVATLEYFFSQTFKILLRYDGDAKRKLRDQTRKVEMLDLLKVADATKRVEDVVAEWYSFQNISSIHAAFKEWLNIDFRRLLRRRRKVAGRIFFLDEGLERLIQFRHGIIHHFELNHDLSRAQIDQLLATSLLLIDTITDYLERDRGVEILDPWLRQWRRSLKQRPANHTAQA